MYIDIYDEMFNIYKNKNKITISNKTLLEYNTSSIMNTELRNNEKDKNLQDKDFFS